jgi:putative NADH-flavin reductase
MRLLVLGATGGTGRHVVTQALEQGHQVTALARRAKQLPIRHQNLATVATDLTMDDGVLAQTLPGHDAVISALGRGTSLRSHGFITVAVTRLVSAMEETRARRLIFLSAYGVGGTAPGAPWPFRLMFRFMLADIYADKAKGEAAVRQSSLAWTILAPVILSNAPATGRYRTGENLTISGIAKIPRVDVAASILGCLADPATIHRRLVVAP